MGWQVTRDREVIDDVERMKPADPPSDPVLKLIGKALLAAIFIGTNVNLELLRSRLNQLIVDAKPVCAFDLYSSVQFSRSVMSDSFQPHGLQHTRPSCPSPTPGAYSDSCPLNQWCHPTILSSVVPFSCLQSFPASGSFQMSQFFASGGQRFGGSASASVLPMNIQDWFPSGWTVWISFWTRDSQESSPAPQFKTSILRRSAFFIVQLSHPYMTSGKAIALNRWTFVGKEISLFFNMLSRFVITFLLGARVF